MQTTIEALLFGLGLACFGLFCFVLGALVVFIRLKTLPKVKDEEVKAPPTQPPPVRRMV